MFVDTTIKLTHEDQKKIRDLVANALKIKPDEGCKPDVWARYMDSVTMLTDELAKDAFIKGVEVGRKLK